MFRRLLAATAALLLAPPLAAAEREPDPAIWLLSDHDTKIYLLGTVHMLPVGFKWQSPGVERTIREASELVVETYFGPDDEDAAGLVGAMILERSKPILDRVPDERRKDLAAAIRRTDIPVEVFDMMPTWAAAFVLGTAQLLGGYGVDDADDAPGVEDFLEERFRTDGKPIHSIEEAETVLTGLRRMKPADQVALLLDAIPQEQAIEMADDDAMNLHWVAGSADELAPEKFGMPPALFDVLLTRRNQAWTGWLIDRLDRPGTVLVAVGAAHLAGDQSVQRLLAERGYPAERVD